MIEKIETKGNKAILREKSGPVMGVINSETIEIEIPDKFYIIDNDRADEFINEANKLGEKYDRAAKKMASEKTTVAIGATFGASVLLGTVGAIIGKKVSHKALLSIGGVLLPFIAAGTVMGAYICIAISRAKNLFNKYGAQQIEYKQEPAGCN